MIDKKHHKRENVGTLFFSQFEELYIVIQGYEWSLYYC